MGLQYWFGASGSGKSYQLYQSIIERAMAEPDRNFLVVVPDQFTMQTQKDLVLMSPGHGIFNIDVLSFGRLAHRVFEEVGGNETPVLDDTGKSLILRKVAAECKDELQVIGKNLHKLGYVHEVKSAISEFMQYGIPVEEMKRVTRKSDKRGSLQAKLNDLTILYEHFLNYIRESYVTTEETLDQLCRAIPRSKVVKNSVICFDGFTGFTPIQNEVICRLCEVAEKVIITLLMDPKEDPYEKMSEQKLFYLSAKTAENLNRICKERHISREQDVFLKKIPVKRFESNPELAHLEEYLFRYPTKKYQGKPERITIFEASDVKEEIRQVCIKIEELVRKKGYYYRDIAVVTGNLEGYEQSLSEMFARFDIPFFMDTTRGILLNPFIEMIRAALQMIHQNFSYETVFHYLRSGLTGFSLEEIDRFENYVRAYGIRGRKAYENQFVRRKLKEGEDVELERINEIREKFMEQISPLLEQDGTVRGYGLSLYQFVVKNEIQKKLAVFENMFLEKNEPARAKEYGQIYRLVMDLLDQIVGLLGDEKMSLGEFYDILDAGFSEIEVGTIPQNVDRVLIGDIERTRIKQIKTLFFLGVNDGNIPKSGNKGGIISDIDREFLAKVVPEVEFAPTPRQQMYIQKLYLYLNMTKPKESLCISYCKVSGEGKSLRPAYLISTIQKLFPELTIEKPEEKAVMEQLLCPQDGIDFLAKGMREYAANGTGQEWLLPLAAYYGNGEWQKWYEMLLQAAFVAYRDTRLAAKTAQMLYGTILQNSVSRLERFAACQYAHFLQYGLQLQERDEYLFEATDLGTIYHGILELFEKKMEEAGQTWFDFSKEQGEHWIEEAIEEFAVSYGETILYSTARNQYVLTRMKRIMMRTVLTLQRQLRKGVFRPEYVELAFSHIEHLEDLKLGLSKEEQMRLKGRIDRVDTYEDDEHVYVKVIDYKSGKKQFDLVALYYGLQLQLVVYMNAALELQKKKHPDKEVVPAGMLYYHIDDPLAEESSGVDVAEIEDEIAKKLKMNGLVNEEEAIIRLMDRECENKSDVFPVEWKKDGSLSSRSSTMSAEQLRNISEYVSAKIKSIGKEILTGEKKLQPYERGKESACTYCGYQGVCGFDRQFPGHCTNKLEELTEDEVLERMKGGIF